MTLFWFLAAAMTVIALAFVLIPLLRARPATAGPTQNEANLEVLRGQRREIEADVATGLLPADARDEALAELVGRAADDLSAGEAPLAATTRKPWPLVGAMVLVIPAIAFGFYLAMGSPRASDAALTAKADAHVDEKQIVAMVEALAAKMKERPDDPQGWSLLARSMASLGRYQEAADAYARLAALVPGDAQILADYADVLGMAQGRTLAGRPTELIAEALRRDPRNQKALALAGTVALDAKEYARALEHWQALADQLPAGSEDARQIAAIIDDVRQRASAAGVSLKSTVAKSAPAPKAAAATTGAVSGSVKIAPEIASKLSGTETVYIFARAESGPRLPLAVVKATARELPMKFALDDSQAMSPGMNISSAGAVRIEARVSRSGEAAQRSGDFVGASAVVKPGARDVVVLVDQVVP